MAPLSLIWMILQTILLGTERSILPTSLCIVSYPPSWGVLQSVPCTSLQVWSRHSRFYGIGPVTKPLFQATPTKQDLGTSKTFFSTFPMGTPVLFIWEYPLGSMTLLLVSEEMKMHYIAVFCKMIAKIFFFLRF